MTTNDQPSLPATMDDIDRGALPGVNVGPSLGDLRLKIVHKSKPFGWIYGESTEFGDAVEMIVVSMSKRRRKWGSGYSEAEQSGIGQVVVCQSCDSLTARGIAREFTDSEMALLESNKKWDGWHDEVKERRCATINERGFYVNLCPLAAGRGKDWKCRHYFTVAGLVRATRDDAFVPFFWDASGTAAKPAEDAYRKAVNCGMRLRTKDNAPLPRWAAFMPLTLHQTKGKSGSSLVPEIGEIMKLDDATMEQVRVAFVETRLLTSLVNAERETFARQVENLGRAVEPEEPDAGEVADGDVPF